MIYGNLSKSLKMASATVALLGACLAPQADAGLINFNATGGATVGGFNPGTTTGVTSFNLGAGDALAQGAIGNNGGLVVGQTFQLYYQTVINSLNTTSGVVNPVGLNSTYQLTEVSTFRETVTSIASNGTVTFSLAPGGLNSTSIYFEDLTAAGAIKANAATGAGFTNGIQIMSLTTTVDNSTYLDTTKSGATPGTVALNGAGYGGFAGVTTDQGTGGAALGLVVNSGYNPNFFQTPVLSMSLFSSDLKTPFTEIAPSTAFNNPLAPGAPTVAANVGSNNGTSGPDFLFQISGASQSFSAVPEPASVAMTVIGFAGAGLGTVLSRRKNRVASAS